MTFTQPAPTTFDEMVLAMLNTEQMKGQSVYQHGVSVSAHLETLIVYLRDETLPEGDWRLPSWLEEYNKDLLANIHDEETRRLYTMFHDCGKPYCMVKDLTTGQNRFPNHVEASHQIWQLNNGCPIVGKLILNDMVIHTASAEEIKAHLYEWSLKDSATLLLVALAEITSNAKLFGGSESISFKMKWKTVEKRGKQICKHLFAGVA